MERALVGLALLVAVVGCGGDDCPNFPMFGEARIADVVSEASASDVRVTWERAPGDELEAGYYEGAMVFEGEASGATDVDAEVTGDQELVVRFEGGATGSGEPRDVDLAFRIAGCQYQDEHRVTLRLRFDPDSAEFSEVETDYGSCVSVSPARPRRAGAWIGVGAAAAWLLLRRRRRRPSDARDQPTRAIAPSGRGPICHIDPERKTIHGAR